MIDPSAIRTQNSREQEGGFPASEVERATGSKTLGGNRLELQYEGSSTFSSWLEGISRAQCMVYLENYLIRDDRVGRAFRDVLIEKARSGVPVYVVYDWVGCWATPRSYWKPLKQAGVHVRAFNPPTPSWLRDPFGILRRDHRKLIVLDGKVAYVGGFCLGVEWAGRPTHPAWRDTAVKISGPAARAAARAFEATWRGMGESLGLSQKLPILSDVGDTPVWLIEGEPGRTRVYRTIHWVAARAKERIWITDAYFVAPQSVSEALGAAAQQGVDVRILVPAQNNWLLVGSLSRGGYRSLLKSGVRIFEWQGPMIHAKTAVVDGVWSRVGSSNLNSASLIGNWELDVGVLDTELASQLEELFLTDLSSSIEIVLPSRRFEHGIEIPESSGATESLDPQGTLPERMMQIRALGTTQRHVTMAPLVRARGALGDSLAGDRPLGREDRTVLGTVSALILSTAIIAAFFPTFVGVVVAVVACWFGLTTGIRAYLQSRRARSEEREASTTVEVDQGENNS
ncbi:MAG TPA: cardiolipin synthase B [Gemmatimonadetes bacterium]|nr:cardiolipin synthase B [Gemmatimonadota bacterium]